MSGPPQRTRYCSRCLTTFPVDLERCPNLGCRAARPAAGWGELLEADAVIDRTYRIHQRLAIGGAGVTYLAGELGPDGTSEIGPRVAIKVLYQQRDQGSYLRRLSTEAQILQGLNHANIVECRGFVHRSGHSPYLVTRYEEGGSLLDHIRRVGTLSIPVVAGIGRQICWALDVAHRQGVVHRDLKPENVLLVGVVDAGTVPELRVADFGIAKVYGAVGERLTRVGAFVGTPQYAAPEQFDGLAPEPATDVYAVGALLYFCLTARPVADFMAELEPDSQRAHLVRHLPPRLGPGIGTPELRRWMEETLAVAMAVDPGDRCDISQLEARLAAIAEQRDPGFVRMPPAGPVFTSATISRPAGNARTTETLDTGHVEPLVSEDMPEPGNLGFPGGGLAMVEARAPTRPPLRGPDETGSTRVPDLLDRGGVSARADVEASFPSGAAMRPVPEPRRVARSARGLGCGLVATAGAAFAAVVAAVGGWYVFVHTPAVLTGTETNPVAEADWRLVAGTLGERGVAAEVACKDPPALAKPYLAVEVVVEGSGAVRGVRLLNYDFEPARLCVEKELKKAPFPRKGTGPVQVAVTLQR
jgi:serine/threonine protein kinase